MTFFSDKLAPIKDFKGNWYGKLTILAIILFVAHHNTPVALLLVLLFVSKVKEGMGHEERERDERDDRDEREEREEREERR